MIGIVDYGAGNLRSVQKALEAIGERAVISGERQVLDGCDKLILPGVGSFGAGMAELSARGLDSYIRERVKDTKLLGICLGMQFLLEKKFRRGGAPRARAHPRAGDPLYRGQDPADRLERGAGNEDAPLFWDSRRHLFLFRSQLPRRLFRRVFLRKDGISHRLSLRSLLRQRLRRTVSSRKERRRRPAPSEKTSAACNACRGLSGFLQDVSWKICHSAATCSHFSGL